MFSAHPLALQFVIYYDDIEVANPLGAKAGFHKLGTMFINFVFISYPCLTNRCFLLYSGQHPSSLSQAIQLLCVAKSNDIHKYGIDKLLQPFIQQMSVLGQVNFICISFMLHMHLFLRMKVIVYIWEEKT